EEEARTKARKSEAESRLEQAEHDLGRERESLTDTSEVLRKLKAEEEHLRAAQREETALRAEGAARVQETTRSLAQCQEKTDLANAQLSELAARRNGLSRIIEDQR